MCKISSILLMFESSSARLRPKTRNNPQGRASKTGSKSTTNRQTQQLQFALETLDNSHALLLLCSSQKLSQEFLCLRARLAHQLEKHSQCFKYALQALQNLPNCKECLSVYLSHAQEMTQQQLSLPKSVLSILEQTNPELRSLVPGLVSLCPQAKLYSSLSKHLQDSGSQILKMGILQSSSGRRMVALETIAKEEQILMIPKDLLITLQLARSLPLVQKIMAGKVPLRSPKHTHLAVFLLHHFQLGQQSPFSSYLKTLPQDFSHFPINYPEELLKELKGTGFLEQVEHKKHDMKRDYLNIVAIDLSFERFTLEKFCEARLLVSSRVFGIVMEGVKTDALVPMADMLNHRLPKQTSWYYCDRQKGFVIKSMKEIPAGHEVFDSYGQKCNSRFLLHYGFVLPNNPHNEVFFDINLAHLLEGSPRTVRFRVSRCLQSKGFNQMMGLLRVTVNEGPNLQDEEEEEITMGLEALKKTPFRSKENELKVWRTIETLVTSKLIEFPTSTRQDNRALQRTIDQNMKNVIILRRGEREVLSFYQTMSRRMIRFFQSDGRRGDVSIYQVYLNSLAEESQG